MREITCREVYRLEECLRELADHHNGVSVSFRGCFPKKPFRETLAAFEKDVAGGKSRIAVIEEEEQVLGFCKADVCGGEGAVDYLVVLKAYRGCGYGDALLRWALEVFRESGAGRVEVRVVDGNDAVRFYEKYGFRTVSHVLRLK